MIIVHEAQVKRGCIVLRRDLLVDGHRKRAFAAVQASDMNCHAHTRPTRFMRAIFARARNLTLVVHLVVLEHCKLDGLVVMLGLLGLGVRLLLPLLGTTAQTQHQM